MGLDFYFQQLREAVNNDRPCLFIPDLEATRLSDCATPRAIKRPAAPQWCNGSHDRTPDGVIAA
jgi:hypothetical protein